MRSGVQPGGRGQSATACSPDRDQPHTPPPQGASQHRRPLDVHTVEGIGAAVARLRRAAGMTQTQFGELVGASRPWVSSLERGNLRGGQLDTVLACLRALGYRIVLTDIDSGPSTLGDLKDAMRDGPLARRHADLDVGMAGERDGADQRDRA